MESNFKTYTSDSDLVDEVGGNGIHVANTPLSRPLVRSVIKEYEDDLRETFGLSSTRDIYDFIQTLIHQLNDKNEQVAFYQQRHAETWIRLNAIRTLCKMHSLSGMPEGAEIEISFPLDDGRARVVCHGLLKDLNLLLKEEKK